MTEAITVAVITGVFSLIGAFVSAHIAASKSVQKLEIDRAVTDTKLEELTREVRAHNNFAQRMPVVENEIKEIKRRMDEYHHA